MKIVVEYADFAEMKKEPQAVVLGFFSWSLQAHVSLRVFEEWEQEWRVLHPTASVAFYRLDHDGRSRFAPWVFGLVRDDDEGMVGGYGAVAWLRRGGCVGMVRNAAQVGKETLTKMTHEYFGSVIAA